MNDIKQFKLTSGEEIVCQILEWPDEEQESVDVIVRNSYKISTASIGPDGIKYYQFRPWLIYQDEPEQFQIINANHIVGEAIPSSLLLEQYNKTLTENAIREEEMQKRMEKYIHDMQDIIEKLGGDSNSTNKIIKFPKSKFVH